MREFARNALAAAIANEPGSEDGNCFYIFGLIVFVQAMVSFCFAFRHLFATFFRVCFWYRLICNADLRLFD